MGKPKKHKKRSKNTPTSLPMADLADKYRLYQLSVQEPECDVDFFDQVYRENFDAKPKLLREDFCGTAAVCCQWVKRSNKRRAFGVDLDPEPLNWGKEHNLGKLKDSARDRITLMQADVRSVQQEPVDVLAAQNFSFFLFQQRSVLLEYLKIARRNLAGRGVMVLDIMGGNEVLLEDNEDVRELDGFDYIWEQRSFDPITAEQLCYIHFRFPDGSEISEAFEYRWRLWTIPEVCELLLEAGFTRADVYWEGTDRETGEGDGEFARTLHAHNEASWIAYIVGVKHD